MDVTEAAHPRERVDGSLKTHLPPAYRHRQDVEDLQARQYWRTEWRTDASTARAFDIGDASTLGQFPVSRYLRILTFLQPPLCTAFLGTRTRTKLQGRLDRYSFIASCSEGMVLSFRQRYIHEHDAVREILMALQGDRNMILEWITSGEHAFTFTVSMAYTSPDSKTDELLSSPPHG